MKLLSRTMHYGVAKKDDGNWAVVAIVANWPTGRRDLPPTGGADELLVISTHTKRDDAFDAFDAKLA